MLVVVSGAGPRTLAALLCSCVATLACGAPAATPQEERPRDSAQAAPAKSLPRPVRLARNHAARSRGLRAAEVRVVSVRRRTWPDGCLGLGGSGEICSQALVPGYRAVFALRGTRLVYRTDLKSAYRVQPR